MEGLNEDPEDAMVCHASSGPAAPEWVRACTSARPDAKAFARGKRCAATGPPLIPGESGELQGSWHESVMVLPLILDRDVVGV